MDRFARTVVTMTLAGLLGWSTARAATLPPVKQSHALHRRATTHAPSAKLAYQPAQAGLVVAWDPESHTFTMPEPIRRLPLSAAEQNALSRSFVGLQEMRHHDGSVSVDLQGRFQEFAVVHLGADGKPVYRCLDDTSTVRRALLEPMPASGLEER